MERVDLKLEIGEVRIVLGHAADLRCPCPEDGVSCALHDHQPERQWRHLDTCQYKKILHAAPRATGKTHLAIALGVKAVENGFSVAFYRLLDLLYAMKAGRRRPPPAAFGGRSI